MLRKPAVAGTFYDDSPEELRETIETCYLGSYGPGRLPTPSPPSTRQIVGLVAPHAGYRFSGYAAAAAYCELAEDGMPDTAVIVGPNHRGLGARSAIMVNGTWETPLGTVNVDTSMAEAILGGSGLLKDDPRAHIPEHSIEVQIPFLQMLRPSIKIVPIVLSVLPWEDGEIYAEDLGRSIANAIGEKNAVVIASTDFTHYETKAAAQRKDQTAIGAVAALDYPQLLDTVVRDGISMCGAVPTAVTIAASKNLGAVRAELLSYYTSGDITGDTSEVVGYGALKLVRGE